MGEASKIGWTDDTANIWIGCDKVSAGCKHCYAEMSTPVRVSRAGCDAREAQDATDDAPAVKARAARAPLELWGRDAARRETQGWKTNLRRWNREARASGKVRRVFAQSLSDTFEARPHHGVIRSNGTMATLDIMRAEFFALVEECDALTLQMLTKRPENIARMVPPSWLTSWPAHVQIGCTVEDQNAERRIPHLLAVPAPVRFLSVEPQIGPVDLSAWIYPCSKCGQSWNPHEPWCCSTRDPHGLHRWAPSIAWVICGGESGSKARPFDLAWARSLRDQCAGAGVPMFLKQLGARPTERNTYANGDTTGERRFVDLQDSHGGDESEWPADLRGCRAFP